MDRGKWPGQSTYPGDVRFKAALLGGGAATNLTLPANGVLSDATATFPKGANLATSGTYVSTGLYTIIYSEQVKHALFAQAIVVSAGASPTAALVADVTKITPGTKTITVKVYTPAGVLTDLGTSDMLILNIDAADTSAI